MLINIFAGITDLGIFAAAGDSPATGPESAPIARLAGNGLPMRAAFERAGIKRTPNSMRPSQKCNDSRRSMINPRIDTTAADVGHHRRRTPAQQS
jgi:hypothetical protein